MSVTAGWFKFKSWMLSIWQAPEIQEIRALKLQILGSEAQICVGMAL